MSTEPLIGIFVGGASRRMGGNPKGLLTAPDGATLIERLVRQARAALPVAPIVLVGDAQAYAAFGMTALEDEPSGVGPLGGLRALLLAAQRDGRRSVLALSCDLPFVTEALLRRLAREQPDASALAPKDGSLWSPLIARYSAAAIDAVERTLASGRRALQGVFDELAAGARELPLDAAERRQLVDWDTPADVARGSGET